jgi:UDP-glucose-4-epimerase GalE
MRVLVAGGAGYIGSHTVKALLESGFEAGIFDNFSTGYRELVPRGAVLEGDLLHLPEIQAAMRKFPCDAVMHFASLIQVGESFRDPQKYYTSNLVSSLNLLEAALEAGVKTIIFSSSAAVYGSPDTVPISEHHPLRPANPYGQTKYFVETILQDYARAYGIRFISLRYFNAAGADPEGELGEMHEPETHLIPNILRSLLDPSRELEVYGTDFATPDGTAVRDYIHVSDLANAHILALKRLQQGGEGGFVNLGANQGYSVREVIHKVQEITGMPVKYREAPRRKGDVPVLLASRERAEEWLGWKLRFSDLDTIVGTAWEWHRRRHSRP